MWLICFTEGPNIVGKRNYRPRGSIQTYMRTLLCFAMAAMLFAQQTPSQSPATPGATPEQPTFRTSIPFVLAPVTVTDRDGQFMSGLTPADFRLLDNGK